MKLNRLGDYIELIDVRNSDLIFDASSLRGISINKILTSTKANIDNLNLKPYKIVKHNWFTYCTVTSRNGNKISLAYNDGNDCIVSSINPVFKIKDESKLLPRYLMMFFNRPEFDRYARFNSWGSARETFTWEDLCNTMLCIPKIEIQRKYVAIYEAMLANLHSYQKGLDDLKLTLEILFDKNKSINKTPLKNILKINNRNNEGFKVNYTCLRGINENCELGATRDSVKPNQVDKYRLIPVGSFTINFMCLGNFGKFYLAYNDTSTDVIVSPACNGFDLLSNEVDPYYLVAYLRRTEFQRRCVFCGAGNTRGGINFDDFAALEIGLPIKTIQESIGKIYRLYDSRRKNAEFLKNKITTLCPILIRGSILEAEGDN